MGKSEDWRGLKRKIDRVKREYDSQCELHPSTQMCSLLILGEDHRFYRHPGFDPVALCRATWKTLACGQREGGSTIAMQLVRTLTRKYDKTILRKTREIALAVRLTQYIPQKDLPGLYLWSAYYGWRMNNFRQACDQLGIDPASRDLHSAAQLVARLKYPQPKTTSAKRLRKIEQRCVYLIERYNRIKRQSNVTQEIAMKPFEFSPSLAKITDRYPCAKQVRKVACEGEDSDRVAIARQWISEGIPFAFQKCPAVYESLRAWLSEELDVEAKKISLTGSARLGSSLSPKKLGEPFGPKSDLDLFVVSKKLFQLMCDDFCRWSSDYQNGRISPENNKEKGYWKNNNHRGPGLIKRGFMDSWMVPTRGGYETFKKINQVMDCLIEKLKNTKHAPCPPKASLRCYKSWESYECQILINLKLL